MRISDWSSDVCSSDLTINFFLKAALGVKPPFDLYQMVRINAPARRSRTMRSRCSGVTRRVSCGSWERTSSTLTLRIVGVGLRSEEHTSELQSLMRISYAVFCLKKKRQKHITNKLTHN